MKKKLWKRLFAGIMSLALAAAMLTPTEPVSAEESGAVSYLDGTYRGVGKGRNGNIILNVTLSGGKVTEVAEISQQESSWIWQNAQTLLTTITASRPTYEQVDQIDGVSGATLSSNGIKAAVKDAFLQAREGIAGTGTQNDPYMIRTAEQLRDFATDVDNGNKYAGQYVELAGDIDLSGIENWNPIGSEEKSNSNIFSGNFNGNGYCISNYKINNVYNSGNDIYIGLFSNLSKDAIINNLNIKNAEITVTTTGRKIHAGLVSGYAERNGTIINSCNVQGKILIQGGDSASGGILGTAMNSTKVLNCYADVDIQASGIIDSYSVDAGGIVGYAGNNTLIVNASAHGTIDAKTAQNVQSGGIAGNTSGQLWNVASDLNTGASSGGITQNTGVLLGNLLYGQINYSYYALDAVVSMNDENVPVVAVGESNGSNYSAQSVSRADMSTATFATTMSGNLPAVYRSLKANGTDITLKNWTASDDGIVRPDGADWYETEIDGAIFDGGAGTVESPYLIASADTLRTFAKSLSTGIDYNGTYVQLSADIDIRGSDWYPIGGSRYAFDGIFDGAGHTIDGLTEGTAENPTILSTDTDPEKFSNSIGLFGSLGPNSRVSNLTLSNVAIYTWRADSSFVGGIAGYMQGLQAGSSYQGAIVDNCKVIGTIEATSNKNNNYVGGIAGRQYKGAIINTMTHVNATCKVEEGEAVAGVGGITGMTNRGLVANCYALGDSTGDMFRDALNEIEGMAAVSSLVGVDAGDVVNCYSRGNNNSLKYSIYIGAIAGWVTGIGKAYDSYYDLDKTMTIEERQEPEPQAYGTKVIGGVNEEGEAFEGGVVDGLTGFRAAEYPQLADKLNNNFTAFGINLSKYGLQADALKNWVYDGTTVTYGDTYGTITYVQKEAEKVPVVPLVMEDGIWYGRDNDSKVVVKITVQNHDIVATEVLQGSSADTENYENALAVAQNKACYGDTTSYGKGDVTRFAGGKGTKEQPYLIANEEQLRYIAEAINADETWENVYFKQINNITLSDKEWLPIGWGIKAKIKGDPVLYSAYPFRGHYDGGNYIIYNLQMGTETEPVNKFTAAMFGFAGGDYDSNLTFDEGTLKVELKNIRLQNVYINNEVQWDTYTAGLLGTGQNGVFIDNCSVTGKIRVKASDIASRAAGLASSMLRGGVYNCDTNVDITAITEDGDVYAGGMFSVTNRINVLNCYALGNVSGDANTNNKVHVGGFTGMAGGFQYNCYAVGNVTSNRPTIDLGIMDGRIAGVAYDRNCYYNTDAKMTQNGTELTPVYTGADVTGSSKDVVFGKSAQELRTQDFVALLNTNREDIVSELQAADEELDGVMSIYYTAGTEGLKEWKLVNGIAGFERPYISNSSIEKPSRSSNSTTISADSNSGSNNSGSSGSGGFESSGNSNISTEPAANGTTNQTTPIVPSTENILGVENKVVEHVTQNEQGFFVDESGNVVTNSIVETEDGKKYITDSDGKKKTSEVVTTEDGTMYAVTKSGVVAENRTVQLDGKKYYAKEDGALAVNELVTTAKGVKVYAKKDGTLATNELVQLDGKKYFAKKSGVIATSTFSTTENGKKVYSTKSGAIVTNKLFTVSGKKYYANKSGIVVTNKLVKVAGKKHYANKNGVLVTNKLVKVSGAQYYTNKSGVIVTNKWVTTGNKKYYCGKDGKIKKTKKIN